MTTTNENKQQQLNRLAELAKLSRKRYLANGGDPRLSVGSLNHNDCLTDEEKQEFSFLFNQLVLDQDIEHYLENKSLTPKIIIDHG
ncbi:hypothetical protein [Gloeothece verrucosa]|uniref:Uncharacterized protein n=1 Tax=Gloeothece verrucosa (strain PCC 7822) TaxID=497965 RepID=E0UEV9_GLOV7|nr:hypothetical protein [Gloeothece verrucosa]ADN13089.1 hypothetical protein Cyan7822_1081 [Gloeothece verrucosa PCC 7822]